MRSSRRRRRPRGRRRPPRGAPQLSAWAIASASSRLPTPPGPVSSTLEGNESRAMACEMRVTTLRRPTISWNGIALSASWHSTAAEPPRGGGRRPARQARSSGRRRGIQLAASISVSATAAGRRSAGGACSWLRPYPVLTRTPHAARARDKHQADRTNATGQAAGRRRRLPTPAAPFARHRSAAVRSRVDACLQKEGTEPASRSVTSQGHALRFRRALPTGISSVRDATL